VVRSGPLSLFLSYAHADALIVEALRKHLAPLHHEGIIEHWHDRDLKPGELWDDEISARLESADIVIALISADFVASEYAYGRELRRALELHRLGELVLVPVIARACHWQNLPIGALQALPDGARPITSWDDVDAAYVTVVRGIESAARARLGAGNSLVDDWLTSRLIRRRVIRSVQELLQASGFYHGPIDGVAGGLTENAVRACQKDAGITVDGMIGPEVIQHLEDMGTR
jgi:TIR domain/Putative peptidoglycan binding domain